MEQENVKASILAPAREALVAVILKAGEVSYRRSEADGWWGVSVDADGSLRFKGYAAGVYPAEATLDDLDFSDVAYLAMAAAEKLAAEER